MKKEKKYSIELSKSEYNALRLLVSCGVSNTGFLTLQNYEDGKIAGIKCY